MKKLLLVCFIGFSVVGCGEDKPQAQISPECDGAVVTGKVYPVLGRHYLNAKNGDEYTPIINQKYKEVTGEIDYLSISSGSDIIEECVLDNHSFVRLTAPEYLVDTYIGWIPESALYKGQPLDDPYVLSISDTVTTTPYDPDDFEELSKLVGKDFPKVDKLRYLAAKAAIDSKKCNYVYSSNIDVFNMGTKDNLRFIVDCKNDIRVTIDEKTINGDGRIKTALELAIPQNLATENCNKLIKDKASKFGEIDIYSLTGTSYDVNKTNGNASVDVFFDVKNKLGVTEKFKARCLFESETWNSEINIQAR